MTSMTTAWPVIPKDAIEYFREVFAEANRVATERLINVPNIRETTLDDTLVDALIPFSPPRLLQSGAVVAMDIHNIGGLRRLHKWETADVGVVVFIYRGSQMIAQKIGLLQTKRLFPKNNDVIEDDPEGFRYGMNAFLNRDSRSPLAVLNRQFVFDDACIYGSMSADSDQVGAINHLNQRFGDSVYYMFYNPSAVPITVQYPVTSKNVITDVELGCRVFSASEVHAVLDTLKKGVSPTLKAVTDGGTQSAWRLEEWVADYLLVCKAGQRFDKSREEQIHMLLERRSGPIGAAIAISIALPGD